MGKGRNLHIPCGNCGAELNTWDARVSKALGYRNTIVCEACICKEYGVTVFPILHATNKRDKQYTENSKYKLVWVNDQDDE